MQSMFIFLCLTNICFNNLCGSYGIGYKNKNVGTLPPIEIINNNDMSQTDDQWTALAIQNIAYSVRNYRFNEWDRRHYNQKPSEEYLGFYKNFPNPTFGTLHFRVKEFCSQGFYECISYLNFTLISKQFGGENNDENIFMGKAIPVKKDSFNRPDNGCRFALTNLEDVANPFLDSFERFKWLTTAAYYMCWYTMLGVPFLSMLGEPCDNFANCGAPGYTHHNNDPRSDDRLPFSCALYSFCPDPCCPKKQIKNLDECADEHNPCYFEDLKSECDLIKNNNQNLKGIANNEWNVTCKCEENGFVWNSKMGMCVDINECSIGEHDCCNKTQECINLPGTYKCACKFGYAFNKDNNCVALNPYESFAEEKNDSISLFDKLLNLFTF